MVHCRTMLQCDELMHQLLTAFRGQRSRAECENGGAPALLGEGDDARLTLQIRDETGRKRGVAKLFGRRVGAEGPSGLADVQMMVDLSDLLVPVRHLETELVTLVLVRGFKLACSPCRCRFSIPAGATRSFGLSSRSPQNNRPAFVHRTTDPRLMSGRPQEGSLMSFFTSKLVFPNEETCWAFLETVRWPDGTVCPDAIASLMLSRGSLAPPMALPFLRGPLPRRTGHGHRGQPFAAAHLVQGNPSSRRET